MRKQPPPGPTGTAITSFDPDLVREIEQGEIDFESVLAHTAARDQLIETVRTVVHQWQHPNRHGVRLGSAAAMGLIEQALHLHDDPA